MWKIIREKKLKSKKRGGDVSVRGDIAFEKDRQSETRKCVKTRKAGREEPGRKEMLSRKKDHTAAHGGEKTRCTYTPDRVYADSHWDGGGGHKKSSCSLLFSPSHFSTVFLVLKTRLSRLSCMRRARQSLGQERRLEKTKSLVGSAVKPMQRRKTKFPLARIEKGGTMSTTRK